MMIFTSNQVVIPTNRIYSIKTMTSENGNYSSIIISYDSGDLTEFQGTMVPQVDTEYVRFDSVEGAVNCLRKFYLACRANENAFFFGED